MSKEDKGRMRVIVFDLEGSNETLLESIRNITSTIRTTFAPAIRTVKSLPNADGNGDTLMIEGADDEVVEDEDYPSEPTPVVSRPKKPRKVVSPNVVKDLDLTSGPMPFRTFCEEKSPTTLHDKTEVIATWLKDYRQIDEIGVDLVFTCYLHMKWDSPTDYGQLLRNVTRRTKHFSKGSGDGLFAINHLGLDHVKNMNKPS